MHDRRSMDPRNRVTAGLNLGRLRQEGRRAARPAVLVAVSAALTLAMAGWFLTHISEVFGHKTYDVRFQVDNAFGIFEGFDDVRFRGVPAGTIERIERHGTQLVLVARLQRKYGPIYNDARAEVRPITPLNDVYLDIVDPGTPAAGRAQADRPLAQRQTTTSVTVPEVLDGLTADARQNAYRLLDNLGNGLADGGLRLRRAFVELGPLLRDAGALSQAVALHKTQTARLVHNTAQLTGELGRRDVQLHRLLATGSAVLVTLQQGSGDLDRTLVQLGPTVRQLDTSLAAVRGVIGDVDAGVSRLYPVAERLPGGLRSLSSLAAVLEPAARRLQPAVTSVDRWAQPVRTLLGDTSQITGGLLPQAPVINRTADDLVACRKGVIGFFQWDASLTKFGDATGGPVARGNLALGVPALSSAGALRDPEQACTPGVPPRGPVGPEDKH
jgi:ABC-type transporter Mla subunit MlaD